MDIRLGTWNVKCENSCKNGSVTSEKDLKEIEWKGVGSIILAPERKKWWAPANIVMNHWVL
jgi:hypothetical protein